MKLVVDLAAISHTSPIFPWSFGILTPSIMFSWLDAV